MKRLIVALSLFLGTCCAALAQRDTVLTTARDTVPRIMQQPHMTFKGIPLAGTQRDFQSRLRAAGFAAGKKRFSGPFAGYDTDIEIHSTPLSGTVYSVSVFLPRSERFEQTEETYLLLKSNLTAVYGEPDTCIERYSRPYTKGDGFAMKALAEGKANFITIWSTERGSISCSIAPYEGASCTMISYSDAMGCDIYNKERQIQIRKDL